MTDPTLRSELPWKQRWLLNTAFVLLHGFGMGAATWAQNFRDLHDIDGRVVFAIDGPGIGLSRSATPIPASASPRRGDAPVVDELEEFLVDFLESWREAMG